MHIKRVLSIAAGVVLLSSALGAAQSEPSVDYVLPWRVAAGTSRVRVTVHGRGLADCSVVTVRRSTASRDVAANLVGKSLVFTIPEDMLSTPGEISLQIGSQPSVARIEVVAAAPTPEKDPFVAKVTPAKSARPASGKTQFHVQGENIDPKAIVLFRPEGVGGSETRLEAAPATGSSQLDVWVPAGIVSSPGAYELRVVNPTARQSNWSRIEIE